MKIDRRNPKRGHTNAELLEICDYAMDEDVHVQISMEDVDRLDIMLWQWDEKSLSPWVVVEQLRDAITLDEFKKRIVLP